MTVLAATKWASNAELIEDVASLDYLRVEWRTLDATYGLGTWWKKFRPFDLVMHNRDEDGSDFRDLPYGDAEFDAIAFDPPYVCMGGRTTSTIDLGERYGLLDAPRSPADLQVLINQGLTEMRRLIKPKGIVLSKSQSYITSGKLWSGTYWTERKARILGFEVVDRFEHLSLPGPQPAHRRQVHARRNHSTLLVLQAPR